MEKLFKDYLFQKHILVCEGDDGKENAAAVLVSLAQLFGIRIVRGSGLARREMISFSSELLGIDVPEAFYKGFPQSVRSLSPDQLLLDQLFHYMQTYGLGNWEGATRSLFENYMGRSAFREKTEIREFSILSEEEACGVLREAVNGLLSSTRPLNDQQYALVLEYLRAYGAEIENCASKNTAVKLLTDTRNPELARFLMMSDVLKLVGEIHYAKTKEKNIRQLNLPNQDRKLIRSVMKALFRAGKCDTVTCFERRADWAGLLHHIHFKAFDEASERFVQSMRGRKNESVYAAFEQAMEQGKVGQAVQVLRAGKGESAVLRRLDYILSRCGNDGEARAVLDGIRTDNTVLLIQLLLHYSSANPAGSGRVFRFVSHNRLTAHAETEAEAAARRSGLTREQTEMARSWTERLLRENLAGRLGRVYIDPAMKKIALPIQESASQGGLGVLARGSRIPIERGKKIRAFTYWEKVNDIDLSMIGLDEHSMQTEFSWRTMSGSQSEAVTFSGDVTDGYNGGAEYYDVDPDLIRKQYPELKYLIFCDNVFTRVPFSKCVCKAGYMTRDVLDSGEIFEPKTVQSSFTVNCGDIFAYLFGIDLAANEFVWLNCANSSQAIVAGQTSLGFLVPYFHVCETINMYSLFEMMASEITDEPALAEVIVSDRDFSSLGEDRQIIRSYDFEKVLKLINQKKKR